MLRIADYAKIIQCIDDLRTKGTQIQLQWIFVHTDIKGNKGADIAAKKVIKQKRAKKKNKKQKELDSGYTAEKRVLKRTKAIIMLELEQKTLKLQEKTQSNKKTGRKLHAICSKPIKKMLKIIQKSLQSGQCPNSIDENKKNQSQKFPILQKNTRIRLIRLPMQVRNAICQVRVDRTPSKCQKKKQDIKEKQKKGGLQKDKLGRDANPAKIC